MKSKLSLSSFCLKNFKAVQNSKTIRFTPLTVFIGRNPKKRLTRIFTQEIGPRRRYVDYRHALLIAREIVDFSRVRDLTLSKDLP